MLMKGIDPPTPAKAGGLPKCVMDARWSEARSQGAMAGAFQPALGVSGLKVTRAPYGGSVSNSSVRTRVARAGSVVGGMRREIFTAVLGRRTLPASSSAGRPAAPVMDSAGRHVLLRRSSTLSGWTGRPRGTQG